MPTTAWLDVLGEFPRRVEAVVRGLPRSLLQWTPAPGKWSIVEVLRHLHETDRLTLVALSAFDPGGGEAKHAAARLDLDASPFEVLRDWKRHRREIFERLRRLDSTAGQAEFVHPTAGPMAVDQLGARQNEHDLHHLKQIESTLERHAILSRLAATPREIRALVTGLPRDAMRTPAATGGGSLLDEVAALCHFEELMLARYAHIVEIDRPPLPPLDVNPTPLRWHEPGSDPLAAVREMERLRALTHEILHALGPRVWQRKGVHPRRGELSIADLVTQHLDRDAEGLSRLRAKRAAVPGIAPAARLAPPELQR